MVGNEGIVFTDTVQNTSEPIRDRAYWAKIRDSNRTMEHTDLFKDIPVDTDALLPGVKVRGVPYGGQTDGQSFENQSTHVPDKFWIEGQV